MPGLGRVCWSCSSHSARPRITAYQEYFLTGDDLEPDPGGPLDIQQPTEIKSKPLLPRDQDDRVRLVFGLKSNDPLPDVDDGMLETYHEYLLRNLVFPFEATHTTETDPFSNRTIRITAIGLGDPDDEPMIDEMVGILCEARHERRVTTLPLGELEAKKGQPNGQLVADYCYWFCNNG